MSGLRIGIAGSLNDPQMPALRRCALVVTAEAGASGKVWGSPVVSVGAVRVDRPGAGVVVASGSDPLAIARAIRNTTALVVVVVAPRDASTCVPLAERIANLRSAGSHVALVEVAPDTLIELSVSDAGIVGLPTSGTRATLPPPESSAPVVPQAQQRRRARERSSVVSDLGPSTAEQKAARRATKVRAVDLGPSTAEQKASRLKAEPIPVAPPPEAKPTKAAPRKPPPEAKP